MYLRSSVDERGFESHLWLNIFEYRFLVAIVFNKLDEKAVFLVTIVLIV